MARPTRAGDSKRYFDWIIHANLDYLSAKCLSDDERLYTAAAFHCQQCIEKALKSYLLFVKGRLFDGHNLTWLCKQAALCDNEFRKWIPKSAALNRYYIETRYPADIPLDVSVDDIITLLEYTGDMLHFISEQIHDEYAERVSN